jgi:preprotein translocase subunit SecA
MEEKKDRLRREKLSRLDDELRATAVQRLQAQGFGLDESQMRTLRARPLRDLDPDAYRALVQDLGAREVTHWGDARIRELPDDQQVVLSAYLGRTIMSGIEQRVLLHTISRLWVDYLTEIEDLRRGIGLEAYGQRDPLVEYKRQAYELFENLGENIRRDVARSLFRQSPQPLEH